MSCKSRIRLLGFGLIISAGLLSACGNLGPTGGHRAQFLVTLSSISPSTVMVGGPPFTLIVTGTNLTGCFATLVWNGGQHIASSGVGQASCQGTQASFVIDATLIANPGSISIAVVDGINSNQVSNSLTLTIMPRAATACALFGLYHYLVTGFDKAGPMVGAGAFGVDATGSVTGEYGFGDPFTPFPFFSPPPDATPGLSGQCTNGSAPGQGTLTLSCACGPATGTITFTYTFVSQQSGGGRLVETNDVVSDFGTMSGSGVFVPAVPDNAFNGNYTFGMTATDTYGDQGLWTHMGAVGQFAFNNGNLNGFADVNDGGTVISNGTVSGPINPSPPFSTNVYSIAQINVNIAGPQGNFFFLMTSPTSGFVVGTVNSPVHSEVNSFVILAGFVSSQANAGTYSNSSLNAPLVFNTLGAPPPLCCTTSTDTTIGLASGFDSGAGTFNLQFDNVSGGVANLNQTVTGATYNVASNGRTTVSYSVGGNTLNYIYYLSDANKGFILGLGNSAEFGSFEPQSSRPFSSASVNGIFASATFLPLVPSSPNLAAEITLNNGQLSANTPSGALTGTYSIAATGRGTATVNLPVLGGKDLVFYVIGPENIVVMGSDNAATDGISFFHF